MKNKNAFLLMLCMASFLANAQTLPKLPNKVDKNGWRQGKWSIWFDAYYQPQTKKDSVVIYRIIEYKDDKPVGLVRDHYLSGVVESQFTLLQDRPTPIMHGEAIFYYEDGTKYGVEQWDNGRLMETTSFNPDGTPAVWENYMRDSEKFMSLQDYKAAMENAVNAVKEAEREHNPDSVNYLRALGHVGYCYYRMGNIHQAEKTYVQIISALERLHGLYNTEGLLTLNNLANVYQDLDQYAASEKTSLRAIAISQKMGREQNVPDHQNNKYLRAVSDLGSLYTITGNYRKGEAKFLEILHASKAASGENTREYGVILVNLANLYSKENPDQFEKIVPLLEQAVSIFKAVRNQQTLAAGMNNLGMAYARQNKINEAKNLYLQALKIEETLVGVEQPAYAKMLLNLGRLYRDTEDYVRADSTLKTASDIITQVMGKNSEMYTTCQFEIALLSFQTHDLVRAETLLQEVNKNLLHQIDKYFPSFSEFEKEAFYKTIRDRFEVFNTFGLRRYAENPDISVAMYNNQLALKAVLFHAANQIRNRILNSGDSTAVKLYNELRTKREYLASVYDLPITAKHKANVDTRVLEEELNGLEKQLSERSELFASESDHRKYTWLDVRNKLHPGEAVVEIIRFHRSDFNKAKALDAEKNVIHRATDSIAYIALIVKPDAKVPTLVQLRNGNELESRTIKYYKNSIRSETQDRLSYDRFWKPIANALGREVRKVYVSPDGVYNEMNVSTLFNPATGRYVFDETQVRLVTNTKDIVMDRNVQTAQRTADLFGFPDYAVKAQAAIVKRHDVTPSYNLRMERGLSLSDLPGTLEEVQTISELLLSNGWRTKLETRQNATEETLKLSEHPQVLHIATHGYFQTDSLNTNPLLSSGLLLAGAQRTIEGQSQEAQEDGIMTAFEAMNLDLNGTDLVVLSACETGLGEIRNGEGVYGLQRAFNVAGAHSVLMSLWKVEDTVTRNLMITFYKEWLKSGDKYQALDIARRKIKKKYKAPYHWGAFVMIGQ